MNRLKLSEIWIYPIKSMGGIRLSSAKVMEKGLQYDRRWMLVNGENGFMTQREYPSMALFKPTLQKTGFSIAHSGSIFFLPFENQLLPQPIKTLVWKDEVTTFEINIEFSEWFSKRLGLSCKLVQFPEENQRPVDPSYQINQENVSLADGYPFLIIGESSLNDLNGRMTQPIPMNRFRPNLVFTGGTPYEEDNWKFFTIGVNKFAGVKPCGRCVMPTINQQTGEKGKEPTATLANYRKIENKIYFGQNVIAINHHEIHEGDEIILR